MQPALSIVLPGITRHTCDPPHEVVLVWTRLSGQETAQAALFAPARLREGKKRAAWATAVQRRLKEIHSQHLGGEGFKETVPHQGAVKA